MTRLAWAIARLVGRAAPWVAYALAAAAYAQTAPPRPISALYGPPAPLPPEPGAAPPLATSPKVAAPLRPDNPLAARAFAVFESHCARCHQTGKLETPLPSGGLGDILDLERLSKDPALVRPQVPDASRVFDVLVTRHAPLDVYPAGAAGGEPLPEEIQAVREWIRQLPQNVGACASRKPAPRDRIANQIREAQRLERDRVANMRFISIAHLYNGCASQDELAAYRHALRKLLNSVSRARTPVKLTALDAEELVFAIRLADFGWTAQDWDLIARAAPPTPALSWPEDIKSRASTNLPIAPGDWLAAVVAEPPVYYALIGAPAKLSDLGREYGVDIDQNIRLGAVRRAVTRVSAVTRGNRVSERHAGKYGALWLVYDFASSSGEQNVFQRPHGPKGRALVAAPFKPDMVRASFVMANGFYGHAIFDAAGNRIDRAAPGVERPYTGADEPAAKAGANCFECHQSGVIGARDVFRGYAAFEPSPLSIDVRASALAMIPPESEMGLLVSGDIERFMGSMAAAGIEANVRLGGDEPVTALIKRYRRPVGFEAALTETGLLRDAFVLQLADAIGEAAPLARRLQQGVLPRPELNRLYALLKGAGPTRAPAPGGFLRDVETEIGLSMWLTPPRPIAGDLVTITAQADADCYLTIISVDAKAKATVLFPNDFEPDNLIRAAKPVSVPSSEAPYQLRFKAYGPETVLARCSTSPKAPMGIEHDFERQRFTALGNWDVFIQDTLLTDLELRTMPEKALRAAAARAVARASSSASATEPRADTMPGQTLRDGRAVLVISVN